MQKNNNNIESSIIEHKPIVSTRSYGENEPLLLVDAEVGDEDATNSNNSDKWRLLNNNNKRCSETIYRSNNPNALTPLHESINFMQSFNNCNFF